MKGTADMTEPRPWNVLELHAGDARGLKQGTYTPRGDNSSGWNQSDQLTRNICRAINTLGYDRATPNYDGTVTVEGVGRSGMLLILIGDYDADGIVVRVVQFGDQRMTAREGLAWLRKRSAR